MFEKLEPTGVFLTEALAFAAQLATALRQERALELPTQLQRHILGLSEHFRCEACLGQITVFLPESPQAIPRLAVGRAEIAVNDLCAPAFVIGLNLLGRELRHGN